MLVNVHSYYSLRYGTIPIDKIIGLLRDYGYDSALLADINNSTGVLQFIRYCNEQGFNGIGGVEFRNGDTQLYTGIAKNIEGFKELNEILTVANLTKTLLPKYAPELSFAYIIYPLGAQPETLSSNEWIGVKTNQVNKLYGLDKKLKARCVILQPVTYHEKSEYRLHCQLRAIDNNILLSQLAQSQAAGRDEILITKNDLMKAFEHFPEIINNTERLMRDCSIHMEFREQKNKKIFTTSRYDDRMLLEKLATEGMNYRYGYGNKEAERRVRKELDIIDQLGFSSYFLITQDIVRYAMSRGFYHVGRGSGANSVVAYCLKITDVCPIELDLYFERFLNPKRKSPPDFDIDFSWDERDDVHDYIFKRYGREHVALMGAMTTFKDRSIIREVGKIYGLPKGDIDRIIDTPGDVQNKNHITAKILSVYKQIEDFPSIRTVHASGVLISELPLTYYSALDMPPKGLQTVQYDMYVAEDIGFEKFDILSQRGIGHIKECVKIVQQNRGIKVDVHDIVSFKKDTKIQEQLRSGETIGCFYVESPAMRQLIKKLRCSTYITLVAASSIIRPGVAKSGMMRTYIERHLCPEKTVYLHPVMEEQLKETYGVMVYQEDVLKVGIHFGGLDAADADVLRRMMSGKSRNAKHLEEIEAKYYSNCTRFGYADELSKEVWRMIESFAGYSFSKAHSASFAVESFQSLFLKTYFPIEFMVGVINNFGGFYDTRTYINEAKRGGATVHLPCVNKGTFMTALYGTNIYLGFIHVKGLERKYAELIPKERLANGEYASMEDFVNRTGITLEQIMILIRTGALRFTGKDKKHLLWEAHGLLQKNKMVVTNSLFVTKAKEYKLPNFVTTKLEDAYDEIELLGWPESISVFDMVRTTFRGEMNSANLIDHIGETVRLVGDFVAAKYVPTAKGTMAFGSFVDVDRNFFDTTNFPQSFRAYPFRGKGAYLLKGKIVDEFGVPSIEVEKMAKLPIFNDPRSE